MPVSNRTATYVSDIPDCSPPVADAQAAETYKFPQPDRREERRC